MTIQKELQKQRVANMVEQFKNKQIDEKDLQLMMYDALDVEDYERCAVLRDVMKAVKDVKTYY